jgi:hypothetical protein
VLAKDSYIDYYQVIEKKSIATGEIENAVRLFNTGVVTAGAVSEDFKYFFFSSCQTLSTGELSTTFGVLTTDKLEPVRLKRI